MLPIDATWPEWIEYCKWNVFQRAHYLSLISARILLRVRRHEAPSLEALLFSSFPLWVLTSTFFLFETLVFFASHDM